LSRLGADVRAIFLGGGVTGQVLDDLLARSGIERTMIEISGDTRLSLTVVERSTGHEYRFVPEGPEVSDAEASAALEAASGDLRLFRRQRVAAARGPGRFLRQAPQPPFASAAPVSSWTRRAHRFALRSTPAEFSW
jgi:hypothetical protein